MPSFVITDGLLIYVVESLVYAKLRQAKTDIFTRSNILKIDACMGKRSLGFRSHSKSN